ncbi:NAD(P)-binding domain-containing protein [Azoarcus sp. DN11]|uniref:NAD(P)-binding domain-containing protein n=1 Tax=Azoarcus sp. DN11 TaxID=356837 RepID=UPI000EB13604|nr:NAD(P)-binding domain-containing protein [Azoarcus sp. DN11]AYH42413.1 4Fe-4S ferredoxin [Azoarcus sp. DN11]
MKDSLIWTLYASPLIIALAYHFAQRTGREARSKAALEEALQAGMAEPSSRYPVVDPAVCMGGGACARACPEEAIGFVGGKAHLVDPAACIGHGVCAPACPVEAITLVYGTAKRGMDIPQVAPSFETNVPGIFIAGELGGLGLIHNAIDQGRLAMESVAKRRAEGELLDVVIVGAGPAGLAATLGAMEKKLRFVTLEQENALGGTPNHRFPRNKLVMTYPVTLPLVGKLKVREILKETLLGLWQSAADRVKMPMNYNERVEQVTPLDKGFVVRTNRAEYRTANVLLALGRGGTPRKLGVPGEDLPKVVYRLTDAEQYRGQAVLVVGGGDSAIEAAVSLAAEPDTRVTLSYRGDAFGRVKPKNRDRLAEAEGAGRLTVVLNSTVTLVEADHVVLDHKGERLALDNDMVIVCAGGILPTAMLKAMGVEVETKYGSA